MTILANALRYFNNVDDDEILHLSEQSTAIYRRVEGCSSYNVAAGEGNLGNEYTNRANSAQDANDLDRSLDNFKLALPHYREAARIYTAINHVDIADKHLRVVAQIEEKIRQIGIVRAAAGAATRG